MPKPNETPALRELNNGVERNRFPDYPISLFTLANVRFVKPKNHADFALSNRVAAKKTIGVAEF